MSAYTLLQLLEPRLLRTADTRVQELLALVQLDVAPLAR